MIIRPDRNQEANIRTIRIQIIPMGNNYRIQWGKGTKWGNITKIQRNY